MLHGCRHSAATRLEVLSMRMTFDLFDKLLNSEMFCFFHNCMCQSWYSEQCRAHPPLRVSPFLFDLLLQLFIGIDTQLCVDSNPPTGLIVLDNWVFLCFGWIRWVSLLLPATSESKSFIHFSLKEIVGGVEVTQKLSRMSPDSITKNSSYSKLGLSDDYYILFDRTSILFVEQVNIVTVSWCLVTFARTARRGWSNKLIIFVILIHGIVKNTNFVLPLSIHGVGTSNMIILEENRSELTHCPVQDQSGLVLRLTSSKFKQFLVLTGHVPFLDASASCHDIRPMLRVLKFVDHLSGIQSLHQVNDHDEGLHRKQKSACGSSSGHQKKQRSFTLTILWDLENPVNTSSTWDEWHCWANTQSERRNISRTGTVRIGWEMVVWFYGMLLLSAKCPRPRSGRENSKWKKIRRTIQRSHNSIRCKPHVLSHAHFLNTPVVPACLRTM